MQHIYYVYILIDPRTNIPFYIGKGQGKRMYRHEKDVMEGYFPHGNGILYLHIQSIVFGGDKIVYEILQEEILDETEAYALESAYILYYKDLLTNIMVFDAVTNYLKNDLACLKAVINDIRIKLIISEREKKRKEEAIINGARMRTIISDQKKKDVFRRYWANLNPPPSDLREKRWVT